MTYHLFPILGGCGLALVTAVMATIDYRIRNFIRRASPPRERLSEDAFFERFYSDSGISRTIVDKAVREISTFFEIELGLVRPSDRFGQEIGGGLLITPDLDRFALHTSERSERVGRTLDWEKISTVDDYIKSVGEEIKQSL